MKLSVVLTILLALSSFVDAAEKIKLQYLPNHPIVQTSLIQIETNDALPGLKLNSNAVQTIQAAVTVNGDNAETTCNHPPLNIEFILKDFKSDVVVNGIKKSFIPSESSRSIPLAQSVRLLNRPINIYLDANLKIENKESNLSQLTQELPFLQEIGFTNFLEGWFEHLFALIGQELMLGRVYEVQASEGNQPGLFYYKITGIDALEVQADITGTKEPKTIKLVGKVDNQEAEITLSGQLHGEVAWNRKNALIYRLKTIYDSNGILKIGENSWKLSLRQTHELNSRTES